MSDKTRNQTSPRHWNSIPCSFPATENRPSKPSKTSLGGAIFPSSQTSASSFSLPDSVPFQSLELGSIRAGITRRDVALPENGNQALHVCLDQDEVRKNRQALAKTTLPLENWALPWQKHTSHIYRITKEDKGRGAYQPEDSILDVDAVYTTEPDILLGVFTADCLGILLLDESIPLVCAVHSGWKGTAQNILHKTLKELQQQNLLNPDQIQVYFSPSIQKPSFEIGPEVKEQLEKAGQEIGLDFSCYIEKDARSNSDRFYADHQAMNIDVLKQAGIPADHIHPSRQDTKTDPSCFSFRRDKEQTGEHFSFAYIQAKKP